jgi:S1-C subfamily serine protease
MRDKTMIEPLLLTTTQITAFDFDRQLSRATGFFFERDGKLYLVTSRHVLFDEPTGHFPNHNEIEFHTDMEDLTRFAVLSIPLHQDGDPVWRQGRDAAGEIDVAVLELDRTALPEAAFFESFAPEHIHIAYDEIEVGASLLLVGYPLGFQDTRHHLPVVRQALIASSFGVRFQGQGYFLTDARTHRGSSGAPVVLHETAGNSSLPWKLLGVHSARMDMGPRDLQLDDSLGLNCAWYADILLTLTTTAPCEVSKQQKTP